MSKQKQKQATTAKVALGQTVRVRQGVMDTDYPDMLMGGWAGTVAEVHDDGMFTVRWNEKTLASIHPVFKKRCEKDGLEFELYWIGADDLEPDPGGSLDIEQPKEITTKPLSPKDQDDRIRMVLGLTSNDPLPDVDDGTLETYHEYLSKNLAFPFAAEHREEYGHPERVKVIGLGDPDDEPMIDESYGILCVARLEGQIVTLPLGELDDAKGNPRTVDFPHAPQSLVLSRVEEELITFRLRPTSVSEFPRTWLNIRLPCGINCLPPPQTGRADFPHPAYPEPHRRNAYREFPLRRND